MSGTFRMFIVNIAWIATSGSVSFAQRAIVLRERSVTGLVQRLARAHRLDPQARARIAEQLPRERRVERSQAFERPEGVKARDQTAGCPYDGLQGRRDGPVLFEHDQLLRRIAPPPVRV